MRINVSIEVDVDTTDTDIEDMRSEIIDTAVHYLRGDPSDAVIEPINPPKSPTASLGFSVDHVYTEITSQDDRSTYFGYHVFWPEDSHPGHSSAKAVAPVLQRDVYAWEAHCARKYGVGNGLAIAAVVFVYQFSDTYDMQDLAQRMFDFIWERTAPDEEPLDRLQELVDVDMRGVFNDGT